MAITFVVDYEVKDYEIWKKTFDSNSDVRKAAGVKASPFKKIDNLLQYLSVMNPFNPFYHKGFRNYSYKSLVGHTNCRKKPLELHLILRYSI